MKATDKRVFTYWVTPAGGEMPAYIRLCLDTWRKNIPGLELVILNGDNICEWMDPSLYNDAFRSLTPMLQSDIAAYSVLDRHGGVFMDADTVVFSDIFKEIAALGENGLYFFGDAAGKAIHVAFIAALCRHHPILRYCAEGVKMLLGDYARGKIKPVWNTFGNSVIEALLGHADLARQITILDRRVYGALPEWIFTEETLPHRAYLRFYFLPASVPAREVAKTAKFGLICLHNSQTPDSYLKLTAGEIMKDGSMLSALLKHALGAE